MMTIIVLVCPSLYSIGLNLRPYCLSSYGRRAFSVAGPAIWNWLPDSLRDLAISRLLQTFTEDVFIFSLLVYIAH